MNWFRQRYTFDSFHSNSISSWNGLAWLAPLPSVMMNCLSASSTHEAGCWVYKLLIRSRILFTLAFNLLPTRYDVNTCHLQRGRHKLHGAVQRRQQPSAGETRDPRHGRVEADQAPPGDRGQPPVSGEERHWDFYIFMTCTKQIFSLPQIGYPSMDERERREINNTTMGYEEVRDNNDTRKGPDGLGVGRDHD